MESTGYAASIQRISGKTGMTALLKHPYLSNFAA
jgi:hypothetical protein